MPAVSRTAANHHAAANHRSANADEVPIAGHPVAIGPIAGYPYISGPGTGRNISRRRADVDSRYAPAWAGKALMPKAPATIAAPNIHFFMLPINPPFQRCVLLYRSGFCHLEASFLPPPWPAVLVLCKHRQVKRLRLRGENKVAQLSPESGLWRLLFAGEKRRTTRYAVS